MYSYIIMKGYKNPYSAQMGSVFMPIRTRNKMETEIPAHEIRFTAPKPILPAPPAKVFDTKSLRRIVPDVMRDAIYREKQAFDNKIRQLNEPILPSLEAERISKELFYAKVANLDAMKKRQLAKGMLTPEQYLEETSRYRSEFDTLTGDASLADLLQRYQDAGLPRPPVNLSNTTIRDPAEYLEALRGLRPAPETGVNVPQLPPTTAQPAGNAPARAQRRTGGGGAPVAIDIDELALRAFEEGRDPDTLRMEALIEAGRRENAERQASLLREIRQRASREVREAGGVAINIPGETEQQRIARFRRQTRGRGRGT
jgi:hypothetical protein